MQPEVQSIMDAANVPLNGDLESAPKKMLFTPSNKGGVHESEFTPLTASEFLAQEPEPVSWVVDETIPEGSLVVWVAKPKAGKTTAITEMAVRTAKGLPFLGRPTNGGGVLILALEEHVRDVKLRLRSLGASGLENLFVYVGAMKPTTKTFEGLHAFIMEHSIKLVVIDILAAFWTVKDENDSAGVTAAIKPLLALARETGACVLLVHHARKAEGDYGDEIRGSGALFAMVDLAIVMKREAVENQRRLCFTGRYAEIPSELIIEMREDGYVALGDAASVSKAARLAKAKAALSDTPEAADVIAKRAGIPIRAIYRLLGILTEAGDAVREGSGTKGSPHRYRNILFHAGAHTIGHESESPKINSLSCTPTYPCTKEKADQEHIEKEIIDAN